MFDRGCAPGGARATKVAVGCLVALVTPYGGDHCCAANAVWLASVPWAAYPSTLCLQTLDRGQSLRNLRQPNLYALLLVIGVACMLWMADVSSQRSRGLRFALLALMGLTVGAVALSASRAGFLLLCCIAVCGLFQLKSSRWRGITFLCVPLIYIAFRILFTLLSEHDILPYFGSTRALSLSESANGDRYAIWNAAIKLISDYPLLGVGYKRFAQYAFTDGHVVVLSLHLENAHNVLMQLAMDFGLPITMLLVGLVLYSLYRCLPLARNFSGRVTLFLLVAPLLHDLVEYPLEYIYFLFPWAFLLGVALVKASASPSVAESKQSPPDRNFTARQINGWMILPMLLIIAPVFAAHDIKKVLALYDVNTFAIGHERLTKAYGTVLFTFFADYSALTILPPSPELAAIQLSLAKKVAISRFDDVVASVYASSAALVGQECLAKAVAYKIWLMDKKAFAEFKAEVAKSTFPQMKALIAFNEKPFPVAWSKRGSTECAFSANY